MKVKIQVTQGEWTETPEKDRARILELMKEYGYDTKALEGLERETKVSDDDIYNQFYGDES